MIPLLLATPAAAIITVGGEGRLLAPPVGTYRDAGVQYTGHWGGFVGTAIGPHHFITAGHVGGGVGDAFTLGDREYTAEGVTAVPETDLAVWRVRERFPRWAPLYSKDKEIGREIIVFGRGCKRGRPAIIDGVMHGWYWGESDGLLSWGRNRVDAAVFLPGGAQMLAFGFDQTCGDEEGTFGAGDSGGGVFVQDGTEWRLAGVNHASGGQYSHFESGAPTFMAALYDARGLYQDSGDGWKRHDRDAPGPVTTLAFATRISPHTAEILSIIGADPSAEEKKPLSVRTYLMLAAGLLTLVAIFFAVKWRRGERV